MSRKRAYIPYVPYVRFGRVGYGMYYYALYVPLCMGMYTMSVLPHMPDVRPGQTLPKRYLDSCLIRVVSGPGMGRM